jgi:hypothetical protein
MSRSQWFVVGLLIALLVIEIAFSPRNQGLKHIVPTASNGFRINLQPDQQKASIFWIAAGLGLVGLTSLMPRAGVALTAVIVGSVALAHYVPLTGWLNDATAAITGKQGQAAMDLTPTQGGVLAHLNAGAGLRG